MKKPIPSFVSKNFLGAVFASCAVCTVIAADNIWQGSSDNLINSDASWTLGIPTGGTIGQIKVNNDFTLVVPAGGLTDYTSTTFFKAITAGKTATVDATKGAWIKPAGTYGNTYQSFLFSNNDGDGHIFTIENFQGTNKPIVKFSDGKIVFYAKDMGTGSTVEFQSGTLNTYDPLGEDVGSGVNTLFLTTARGGGDKSRVIFQPDSCLRANDVQVNGAPNDTLILIAGGMHEIRRTLSVGTTNPSSDKDPTHPLFRMTNGTLTVGGLVSVASRGNGDYISGSTGRIELRGGAELLANSMEIGNNASTSVSVTGIVEVAESARLSTVGNLYVGHNQGGTGFLVLGDDASVVTGQGLHLGCSGRGELEATGCATLTTTEEMESTIGNAASGTGVARLSGNAAVTLAGPATLGNSGLADIEIAGDATLTCMHNLWMGRKGGSIKLTVRENGSFVHAGTAGDIYVSGTKGNTAQAARIDVLGGTFTSTRTLCSSATNSVFNFAGGRVSVAAIGLGSSDNPCAASTNVLAISGGSHETTGTGGVQLGLAKTTARLEMSGGELKVGSDGARAVKVAYGSGSFGSAVLTGGTISGFVVGGDGTSSALFDGVTLRMGSTGTIVEKLGTATLGAKGLTVEADNHAACISQSFVDASGVDGVVTVLGSSSGTLYPYADSHHAKTVVRGVSFLAENRETLVFGRNVLVTEGATLDLSGTVSTFACDTLTLGDGERGKGFVAMDAGDLIVASNGLVAVRGGLTHAKTDTNGRYPIARTKASEIGSHFGVRNLVEGHVYAFETSEPDTDGWMTVSLVVSDASGQGVTHDESTTVTDNRILVWGIGVSGLGTEVTYAGDVVLGGCFAIDVATGCSLTFSGMLDAAYAAVMRMGMGQLNLKANASTFEGRWSLSGGRTVFTRADAFGVDNAEADALTLVSGTLKYVGEKPARLTRGLTVATGSNGGRVVVETASPLTIAAPVASTGGSVVKTGCAPLVFELPEGTQSLGTGNNNTADSAVTSLPTDGSSPSAGTQAGLQVLEGELVLRGAGRDKTTLNQTQTTFVGTGWSGATTNAALTIEDLTMNQGGASRPLIVGNGALINKCPALTVRNAAVSGNTLYVGQKDGEMYPELYMTNSQLTMIYEIDIGAAFDKVCPKVTVDAGAELLQYRASGVATGIRFYRNFDVVVRNGGRLESRSSGSSGNCGFNLTSSSFGTVRVENGGTLATYKIQDDATSATSAKHVDFVFDGGILELTGAGTYAFAQNEWGGFIATNAGLTVDAKADVTLASPVRGDGSVTKRGAGTLTLSAIGEAINVLRQTGGVCVAEGTLDLGGTSQQIDGLWGAGRVTNGTLSGSLRTKAGASSDEVIELGEGLVFGQIGLVLENADEAKPGDLLPVARVAESVTLSEETVRTWLGRVTCLGERLRLVGAKIENGIVYAQILKNPGLLMIVK